jgi:hypothetical protein
MQAHATRTTQINNQGVCLYTHLPKQRTIAAFCLVDDMFMHAVLHAISHV